MIIHVQKDIWVPLHKYQNTGIPRKCLPGNILHPYCGSMPQNLFLPHSNFYFPYLFDMSGNFCAIVGTFSTECADVFRQMSACFCAIISPSYPFHKASEWGSLLLLLRKRFRNGIYSSMFGYLKCAFSVILKVFSYFLFLGDRTMRLCFLYDISMNSFLG